MPAHHPAGTPALRSPGRRWPGLKPVGYCAADAALKGRSSTSAGARRSSTEPRCGKVGTVWLVENPTLGAGGAEGCTRR
jgi:hypothetical protein